MFKSLVKTRIQMFLAAMFRSRKKEKRRSKAGVAGYGLLMFYVAACFLILFYMMASSLCEPLLMLDLGWLYFALMGIMALAMGVIGSVFTAQTQLFEAKDNELLLSMPIPPGYILGSRMVALYGQSFLSSAFVLLPTAAAYAQVASPTGAQWAMLGGMVLLLPLLSLFLSCVLGWLVALISSRMRNKSLITLVLSLVFLGAYFYFYFRMQHYLELLVANGEAVGQAVRTYLFPLYQMGLAAQGSGLAFVWFALCAVIPFGVIYVVLSRSFIRIATTRRGTAKIRYREKTLQVSGQDRALLQRELRHLWSSPMYMLNGAFGSVFLLLGAVLAVVKRQWLLDLLGQLPGFEPFLALAGCGCICLVAAMNIITAPSVSLEGKSIWLLQSLPVSGWQVLRAKLRMHMLITAVPAALCGLALDIVLVPQPLMAVLLAVTPVVFSWLCAVLGLVINLLMPRLDWVSEAYAVKQSGSSFLSIFANWGVVLVFVLVFVLLRNTLRFDLMLVLATALMVFITWILRCWIRRRGAAIFQYLS